MEAKCPECLGQKTECRKCGGTGQIEVSFGSGPLYTRACLNDKCGYENGGHIVMEGRPKGPDGEPPNLPGECIMCKSPCRWKYCGEM